VLWNKAIDAKSRDEKDKQSNKDEGTGEGLPFRWQYSGSLE
jgi:hypothetical protein